MKFLALAFVATLLPVLAASCKSSTTGAACTTAADCGHGNGPSQQPPYKWTCKNGVVCSECTDSTDCAAVDSFRPFCVINGSYNGPNTCVQCSADDECVGLGATGKIVASSTHCANGSCGPCATDADCPGGHATCFHTGGASECRECVVDADCKDPAFPFCAPTGDTGVSYCGECRDYNLGADCKDPAKPRCKQGAAFPYRVVCQAP